MITRDRFLAFVGENAARIKEYELGHDGRDGKADCVGFVIGSLRLAGETYTGTHGSNYFARYYTNNLRVIKNELEDLKIGDVVYKAYNQDDSKYNLPDRYKNSGDLLDYYHIGVVVCMNPIMIWHCSSGGMHYDSSLGKWKYAGEVKTVDYSKEDEKKMETPYIAEVATQSGNLNVRPGPSTEDGVIGKLPKGTQVRVSIHGSEWDFIDSPVMGYVANRYLNPIEEVNPEPEPEEDKVTIKVSVSTVKEWITVLNDILQTLEG